MTLRTKLLLAQTPLGIALALYERYTKIWSYAVAGPA
jgi:hypothetical protein